MTNESLKQYFKTNLIKNSPPFKEEYPKGEVVKKRISTKTTPAYFGEAKKISNLPHLKTFRRELRNNSTSAEATLWTLLKNKQLGGKKFRRQHSIGNYILDFYCPAEKLAIELDGEGHFEAAKAEYDSERDLFLERYGVKVLRFENKLVWENTEALLQRVKDEFGWFDRITETTPPDSVSHPSLQGGESFESKISKLIEDNNSENPFDEKTTKQLIKLINDLKVVDPAVGSGAFPMAMLNKLVFILGKLDPDNKYWKQSQIDGVKKSVSDSVVQRKLIEQIERQFKEKNADYGRKLYLIRKCIYGVDIQQIAVEIAKLRFFISLLVDEKIDLNRPKDNYGIEPLPNLDFKLMQGNSLISTYAGIDFNDNNKPVEGLLFDDDEPYKKLTKEFEELKHQYQNETDNKTKKELRNKIDKAIIKIFEEKISASIPQLKEIEDKAKYFPNEKQREKYIAREKQKLTKILGFDIEQIEKDLVAYTEGRKSKDFFLWNVYFAEVFTTPSDFVSHPSLKGGENKKSGFDIVIGNPPYIQLQKAYNDKIKFADIYKNENYKTFERTGDIYALFYEKGINILTDKGLLCFITSNKWMRANYGKSLRKFLSKNNPLKLIDLGPGVFNTATVDTNILLIVKTQYIASQLKAITFNSKNKKDIAKLTNNDFTTLTKLSEGSWIILSPEEQKIKEKIERIGTPLKDWDININYGIKTGYNEAFIINGKTKDELIAKDPKSAEIIKPILRGRDIKRYKAEFADLWLIATFPALNLNIDEYPAVKGYLQSFGKRLHQTGETFIDRNGNKIKSRKKTGNKWFETQDQIAYHQEFEKEKIVYPNMTKYLPFIYDNMAFYTNQKCFIVTGKSLKYLVSVLNSAISHYYIRQNLPELQGGTRELSKVFFVNHPIPKIPKEKQKPFEELVDKIIAQKAVRQSSLNKAGKDTTAEERKIDIMVYKLYELTYDEVKIIEPDFPLTKEEYENYD